MMSTSDRKILLKSTKNQDLAEVSLRSHTHKNLQSIFFFYKIEHVKC